MQNVFSCPQATDVRAAARQVRGEDSRPAKRTAFSCSRCGATVQHLQRYLTKVHKLEKNSEEVRYRTKYTKICLKVSTTVNGFYLWLHSNGDKAQYGHRWRSTVIFMLSVVPRHNFIYQRTTYIS